MKLHQLRAAVAVAQYGSLREAARRLGVQQPALTRSLGELERGLGAELFQRQTRGMTPTAAGQAFVRRAASILNDVQKARDEVEQIGGGVTGRVVVGLSIAPHLAMLPKVLQPFRRRYPSVQLDIVEGYYPTLENELRTGGIDFYIGPEPIAPLPAGLVMTPMFTNTRTVLCRKGHPLAGVTSLAELAGAEWATTTITERAEAEFETLFASHGLALPKLAVRCQSALTLMVVVANTDILALVPRQWEQFDLARHLLTMPQLRETLPAPTIVQVQRSDLPLTPAALFLHDLMSRHIEKP